MVTTNLSLSVQDENVAMLQQSLADWSLNLTHLQIGKLYVTKNLWTIISKLCSKIIKEFSRSFVAGI